VLSLSPAQPNSMPQVGVSGYLEHAAIMTHSDCFGWPCRAFVVVRSDWSWSSRAYAYPPHAFTLKNKLLSIDTFRDIIDAPSTGAFWASLVYLHISAGMQR
jgi:hypothetical protein